MNLSFFLLVNGQGKKKRILIGIFYLLIAKLLLCGINALI